MGYDPEKPEQQQQQQNQQLPWTQQGEQHLPWTQAQQQPPRYPVVDQSPVYYGTFQGSGDYPQPVPPSQAPHYPNQGDGRFGHQSIQVVQDRLVQGQPLLGGEHYQRHDRLPFCGLGFGWLFFILGFFCIIPWYIGMVIFFCLPHDIREKAGLVACTIVGIICLLAGGIHLGRFFDWKLLGSPTVK